jgi:uncharacterized protein YegJ (DUF2314 family)
MTWWKRKIDLKGEVLFRGGLAPSLKDMSALSSAGVTVTPIATGKDEIWAANLNHPNWGVARLAARRGATPPPDVVAQFASGLTEKEREAIMRDARSVLNLDMTPQTGDVLRDRKQLLRFMAAVLGNDGIAGFDLMAQMFWSPERLAEELQNDAPLDIIHIHVLHFVKQPGGVWLHSHGLGEMGFVDFDVLRPAEALTTHQFDLLRAVAFSIVEGVSSGLIEPAVGGPPVDLIDATAFMRSASAADAALRDPDDHSHRRVVCCDPPAEGLMARLFKAKGARPSALLSEGMNEGKHLVRFSDTATDLAAERARGSLSSFEGFQTEFADLQCTALVKLGYPTDDDDGREHLWFEAHGMNSGKIDATLLNEPFNVSQLKSGGRNEHAAELLTDWAIATPLGQLTPRSLELARRLREKRPMILEWLAQQKER